MALFLSAEDIAAVATVDVTLRAAWQAVQAEQAGTTVLPPRLDVDLPRGFLRVMPAALDSVMGVKIMTLVRGVGNRYLLLLYDQSSGEMSAVFDASEVTRLRTAAVTAVAGQMLAPSPARHLGLIGSGFEAEGHLRAFAAMWPVSRVRVFSPSADRCRAFADRMCGELDIPVEPVASAAAAVDRAPVTVLATKSTVPVVAGAAFEPGSTVLSIGSTRPDLRELDTAAFARASVVLVDSERQVVTESGDVIDAIASGALDGDHLVPMAAALDRAFDVEEGSVRDLRVFKSVGTAIQDLALASEIMVAARKAGIGRELGDLAELKLSNNPRTAVPVPESRL
jgi:alanine dehydrogenase